MATVPPVAIPSFYQDAEVIDREMKPVVILGKGPSARHVPQSDQYDIAAVNEAVRLCERCDYLAVNDVPALMNLTVLDMSLARQLILPQYLHVDPKPKELMHWREAFGNWCNRRNIDIGWYRNVIVYRLHTDPDPEQKRNLPYFGRCRSTSDSLIAYLLHLNYKTIVLVGVEPDGKCGYHKHMPHGVDKPSKWRRSIWRHTDKRIRLAGAMWWHIDDHSCPVVI